MKNSITLFLLLVAGSCHAQSNITAAEYFIDTDPGIGNATAVAVTPAAEVDFSFQVPLSGLPQGTHALHARVINEEGRWSLYARRQFLIQNITPDQQITAIEYFFSEDPGLGNATAVDLVPAADYAQTIAIEIPESLDPGLHVLHIRARQTSGRWSAYTRRLFYVSDFPGQVNIVAAEYFIDSDPGPGEATPLEVTPGNVLDALYDIALPESLAPGEHVLHIRVLNELGNWSHDTPRIFNIDLSFGTDEVGFDFNVYPNPSSGWIVIDTGQRSLDRLILIDIKGVILLDQKQPSNNFDISSYPKGTYLLQLFSDKHALSKRIVLQ